MTEKRKTVVMKEQMNKDWKTRINELMKRLWKGDDMKNVKEQKTERGRKSEKEKRTHIEIIETMWKRSKMNGSKEEDWRITKRKQMYEIKERNRVVIKEQNEYSKSLE